MPKPNEQSGMATWCTFAEPMKRIATVALALALGCSGSSKSPETPIDPMPPEELASPEETAPQEPETPALPGLETIRLTIVAAEVAPKMKDGRPWDGTESRLAPSVSKPLLRYLELHPELLATSNTLGVPVSSPKLAETARKDAAPDPMVYIEVGSQIYRSPVRPRAFAPLWDYPMVFSYGFGKQRMGAVPGSLVRIHVVDYDGPASADIMGTTLMSIEQLLAKPLHQLGPFGSVDSLTLQIKRKPQDEGAPPVAKRLVVPGKPSWTDTGLKLIAGQRLVIEAADEVCTTTEGLDKCSGPEGQAKPGSKNLPGFETVGHGALVATIGDVRFPVGRRLELTAPATGTLRLGVNDRHYVNNRGSYAARITIAPMPVPSERRPPPKPPAVAPTDPGAATHPASDP